jgi:hypothetical protein
MSEAKSGAGVAFIPGCRFAHPGYDMHLVIARSDLSAVAQRAKAESDEAIHSFFARPDGLLRWRSQ